MIINANVGKILMWKKEANFFVSPDNGDRVTLGNVMKTEKESACIFHLIA